MDFQFTDGEERFRGEVQTFLRKELPQGWRGMEPGEAYTGDGLAFTKSMAKKLANKGWLTIAWPKEYGGMGASHMEQLIYREEMSYNRVPATDLGVGAISWVGPTLMLYGSEEQKKEHVPPITRAERYWCTLYSEPGAGSDLASLQTKAVRDGDDYVVNGSKIWTSAGHIADWGWLAARTDPDVPKHKGISIFLLDMKTPGVTVRPVYNMAGAHEFNQVFFDNVRIPGRNRVGEENRGWYILAVALDFERSGVGASAGARRTLEEMIEFVKEPRPDGTRLSQSPLVRSKLAEMAIEVEVARWLAYRVAWMQSKGQVPNKEASISKLYGSEVGQRLARTGMEILGLYGQLSSRSPWAPLKGRVERAYLSSVSGTIAAGSSEIQRNIIAQRGLGMPR